MGSVKIRRVKLRAFQSFVGEQDTGELPDHGLILVRGTNKDTGGSSGAGKSSFIRAIAYALGYCPVPATKLQSWLTKDKMQVEVHLDTDLGPVVVKRGAETSIDINGTVTIGATAVDPQLRKVLNLDPQLLEALCYRPQKKPGKFLSMGDSEKKEFLSTLLGLSELEQLAEEVQKTVSELEVKDASAAQVETSARQQLIDYPFVQCEQEDVTEYERLYAAASETYAKADAQYAEKKAAADKAAAEMRHAQEQVEKEVSDKAVGLRMSARFFVEAEKLKVPKVDEAIRNALVGDLDAAKDRLAALEQQVRDTVSAKEGTRPVRGERLVKLNATLKTCRVKILEARTKYAADRRALEAAIVKAKKEVDTARLNSDDIDEWRSEVEDLRHRVEAAKAGNCPTCKQTWVDGVKGHHVQLQKDLAAKVLLVEAAERWLEQMPTLEAAVKAAEENLAALSTSSIDSLVETEKKIEQAIAVDESGFSGVMATWEAELATIKVEAESRQAKLRSFVAEAESNLSQFDAAHREAVDRHSKSVALLKSQKDAEVQTQVAQLRSTLQEQIADLSRTVTDTAHSSSVAAAVANQAMMAMNVAKKNLDTIVTRNQISEARAADQAKAQLRLQEQLERAVKARSLNKERLALEKEFLFVVGREGFLGHIFDEVLDEISADTNEALAQLPNVGSTTLVFSGESVTKAGKTSRKIVPIVRKSGIECSLDSLSGGQGTSVELAVDLSIGAVIGRRTGVVPGWLALDESFEGHDVVVKEACLEILAAAAKDRLIFVVDHATETKERFDAFLEIECEGDVSRIVGGANE